MSQSAADELLRIVERLEPVSEEDLHAAYLKRLKQRTDPKSAGLLFRAAYSQLLTSDKLHRDSRSVVRVR